VLLRDEATADTVDDALHGAGCRLVNVVPATAVHPEQMIFATSDRRGVVHLVGDGRLGVRYLEGRGGSAAADLAAMARALPAWEPAAVRTLAASGDEADRARAVGLAALGGDDAEAEAALAAALGDGSAAVRAAGLVACAYRPGARVGGAVRRLALEDPEPLVRLHAAALAAAGLVGGDGS
jgi:hypothetical protein